MLVERVGDEYGEKSKLLERDRNGEIRDLPEDVLGELVFNLLSPLVDGPEEDDGDIRGRWRRLRSERALRT